MCDAWDQFTEINLNLAVVSMAKAQEKLTVALVCLLIIRQALQHSNNHNSTFFETSIIFL